jgi:hypothetical protein
MVKVIGAMFFEAGLAVNRKPGRWRPRVTRISRIQATGAKENAVKAPRGVHELHEFHESGRQGQKRTLIYWKRGIDRIEWAGL